MGCSCLLQPEGRLFNLANSIDRRQATAQSFAFGGLLLANAR